MYNIKQQHSSEIKARYNYRIYPKLHQQAALAKAFGCARVVWNDANGIYKDAYTAGLPRPQSVDKLVITQAKKTEARSWLSEVSNIVLQQAYRDLQQAWSNFFNSIKGVRKGKKVACPRFKKKQSRQTIRLTTGGFSVHSASVKLAKIGHIPMVVSRPLPSKPSSVTIIKDTTGRYFASFVVDIQPGIPRQTQESIGIDLGLNHFAILSNGEKIENPRHHKKQLKRIKRASRRLSKCQRDSNRSQKAKLKLASLHAKVKDSRTDFLHKLTTRLVRENQTLAIEDLNVSGMVKNRKLSRAISDAGWSTFRTLLSDKCDKHGRHLAVINRWLPTSQKCSACGQSGGNQFGAKIRGRASTPQIIIESQQITKTSPPPNFKPCLGKKELHIREWQCLHCGAIHDRDINAANNILVAGGLSETVNGRGSKCKTTLVAVCDEPSTTPKIIQLSLF